MSSKARDTCLHMVVIYSPQHKENTNTTRFHHKPNLWDTLTHASHSIMHYPPPLPNECLSSHTQWSLEQTRRDQLTRNHCRQLADCETAVAPKCSEKCCIAQELIVTFLFGPVRIQLQTGLQKTHRLLCSQTNEMYTILCRLIVELTIEPSSNPLFRQVDFSTSF